MAGGDMQRRRALFLAGSAALLAAVAVVGVAGVVGHAAMHRTVLSPVYTADVKPTERWNGLPVDYKFNPFVDEEHTDDLISPDPWSSKGQYGMWMNFQDSTMNSFGCGPKGPMDCNVGTTPSQHFARKVQKGQSAMKKAVAPKGKKPVKQQLSPVYTASSAPTERWNGLPEQYKFNPFVDEEHTDDLISPNPWGGKGQYGMWMGIQDSTVNGWGCGPGGPMDCSVGTTPAQHFAKNKRVGMMKKQTSLANEIWNGLPVNYHNDPFAENPAERVTADPWAAKGQYGIYQNIQPGTINGYGCGPAGPIDCTVGTTPSQHYGRKPQQQPIQIVDIPMSSMNSAGGPQIINI